MSVNIYQWSLSISSTTIDQTINGQCNLFIAIILNRISYLSNKYRHFTQTLHTQL